MPCCRHCCHCLIRGSSGKAGVAACGGSSSSRSRDGSGDGSGAILFLVVVVILLLFACPLLGGIVLPLFVDCCSFHKPPLTRLQRAMVGCCLLLSAALFVVARCPAIIDDCVTGRRPPAHLVTLVSPAASTFVALWTQLSSSSFPLSSSWAAARACRQAQSRGREPAGPPALAAIVVVSAARRGGGWTKPCAAPPIRRCG